MDLIKVEHRFNKLVLSLFYKIKNKWGKTLRESHGNGQKEKRSMKKGWALCNQGIKKPFHGNAHNVPTWLYVFK